MRLLLTLIMAFGVCLASFGAATWPANTNGNNVFFGTNTFSKTILGTATNAVHATNSDLTFAVGIEGVATNLTVYSTNNDYEGIELIESGSTNIALRIDPNQIQYLNSGSIVNPPILISSSGDIYTVGDIKCNVGGFYGNGANLTNLTLPDPMTLNQLNVNTLIVTNKFLTNSIGVTVDGAGTAISSGIKGYISVPYACTIESCTLMADVAGTISFEFWRTNSADASYPPTASGAIGTNTLTADNYNVDSTLTGWTKTLAAGDVLGFNVPATATTITRCTAQLKVTH